MSIDVVIVGGGLGGSGLARLLANKGLGALVLERDVKFKDRVRGENMLAWGVAAARRLGLLEDLMAAGGHSVPLFNVYAMGMQTEARPIPQTTPHGEGMLNMYHPDLQEALLASAVKAGAEVKRGAVVQNVATTNGTHAVTFVENDKSHTINARLVVGADGRNSKLREWGGFSVQRDPNNLRIAGTLIEGTPVPDDGIHLSFGPGILSFIAPLGKKRARTYFVYPGATGDRKLSGKEKYVEFLDLVRATCIPPAWLEGVTVTGPLAEFEGADHWVPAPAKPGLALIGDAAASTDPCWGCGLSKTLLDLENLASRLTETDDWDAALRSYATVHDDYYGKLHDILGWMTELFWTPGPEGAERRGRVLAKMKADPSGYPDAAGVGPFGPCDESARRKLLGLD
jgi:2-polyprenyl-6-methoxyphenol hydroxylase-like FAD-dependent oxidoreductase